MLFRLIGCASFAVVALIVIIAGFLNRDTLSEEHASLRIFPAFAGEAQPMADSVAIVADDAPQVDDDTAQADYDTAQADRALRADDALQADGTRQVTVALHAHGALQTVGLFQADPVLPTEDALYAQSRSYTPVESESLEIATSPERRVVFDTLPLPARTAVGSLQLQDFTPLLETNGFQRAQWQDFNYDMGTTHEHGAVDPFVVVLDPGHGGVDPGSVGYNGLVEKDLTLDIAQRVRLFLTEFDDIDVRLTRNYDHGLSRQSRVSAIQRSQADMVISLHFNHLPQNDVNVVESFFAGPANIAESVIDRRAKDSLPLHHTNNTSLRDIDLGFTSGSARLAASLHQRMYREVSFSDDEVVDAGVKEETLFVLTRSFTPAVLLEISCLSDNDEADRLASEEYRNRLAAALVDGIRDYHDSLKTDPLVKEGDLGA